MNTRLTARAIKVLKYAQYEAQDMERNYIGTEHLLLGLLHESDGLAAQALMALGIDLDMVHERVESVLGADDDSTSDNPYYTPRAKRVMELAVDEARRLGHNYLGTEHILLGLIRENDSAAARVLRSLGAELTVIHNEPDGVNINDACGSTHLESLIRKVKESGADIGVAHDGDADRCLCVDEKGNVIDGDHMLVLCGLALKEKGALPGDTIVTTVMANIGFHKAVKAAGGRVEVTKVGDRYVLEEMRAHGYALGGEQSGHIIFGNLATTGDGLVTALQVLSVLKRSGGPASKLTAMMKSYPQLLVNVEVKSKDGWEENAAIRKAIEAEETLLGENGRILVRPSGTEPLIRVMAEGPEQGQLEEICQRIADVVRAELG